MKPRPGRLAKTPLLRIVNLFHKKQNKRTSLCVRPGSCSDPDGGRSGIRVLKVLLQSLKFSLDKPNFI